MSEERRWINPPILNVVIAEAPFFIVKKQGREIVEGRPDILHRCLITIHDSPLNDVFTIRTFFTLQDERVFQVRSETRIPRMEHRFTGLIKQAIQRGATKNKLIHERERKAFWEEIEKTHVVQLDEKGNYVSLDVLPTVLHEWISREPVTIIVGGFPKGDFHKSYPVDEVLSVYPKGLTASTSLSLILWGFLVQQERWEQKTER